MTTFHGARSAGSAVPSLQSPGKRADQVARSTRALHLTDVLAAELRERARIRNRRWRMRKFVVSVESFVRLGLLVTVGVLSGCHANDTNRYGAQPSLSLADRCLPSR